MAKTVRFPENRAATEGGVVWEKDDIVYSIVPNECGDMRWYCGYCRFPTRPTIEEGYDGILCYVPVHGGITYAELDDDGSMVYGFDCNHAGDEHDPRVNSKEWLSTECERMALAIQRAARYEERYLLASDNEQRAKAIDEFHEELHAHGLAFELEGNFGAMLNVLCGKL